MLTEDVACAIGREIGEARHNSRLDYQQRTRLQIPQIHNTPRSVVKYAAHNGGCSTMSGLMPVSLPRITAIDGVA